MKSAKRDTITGVVLLFLLLLPGQALAGKYSKKFDQRITFSPPPGQDGVEFSAQIRISHDVFFGDATELHVAGKYELGSYAIIKGQRVELSTLPQATLDRLKPRSVSICYDIQSGGSIVSTKCTGTLLSSDMAGSPAWGKFFPGLSAEEAKALFKSGYEIVNVRIMGKQGSQPAASGIAASPAQPQTPLPEASSLPPLEPVAPENLKPGGGCPIPRLESNGSPQAHCAQFNSFCQLSSMRSDGTKLGVSMTSMTFEYRRAVDLPFRSETHGCGPMIHPALNGLEACTEYRLRLRATCDNGSTSEWTDEATMRTACPAPSDLSFSAIKQTSVEVSYRRPGGDCQSDGTASYVVEYMPNGGTWLTRPHSAGLIPLDSLQPGTNYRVRLRTLFPNGATSAWSAVERFKTLD